MTRSGNTTGSTAVTLAWSGAATLTTDYTVAATGTGATLSSNSLTLTFAAGATSATITVTPVDDTLLKPAEDVVLTLVAGTGYTVGRHRPRVARLRIMCRSLGHAPTDASGAEQNSDPIVFTVTRTGAPRRLDGGDAGLERHGDPNHAITRSPPRGTV